MTYEQTKRYDVGLKPHPRFPRQEKIPAIKPLLSDLFDDVEAYVKLKNADPVFYNIETKSLPATDSVFHPAPEEFVELLMRVIRNKKVENKVIIQSFDFRTLQVLHKKYPHIKTAALVEDFDTKPFSEQLRLLGFTPDIYSPHYSLVTEQLVQLCHDKKIKLIPWTVNDLASMERLRAMKVDGIISDYPDLFR
jgi:glycerophosphoryl diester phosphodiesterase